MRPRQLLVLGGSGGARSLNDNVPRALYKAHSLLAGWRIVHQSGEADLDATRELYRKLDIDATVSAFVADVPEVLAVSDLAICRAGGTTLAELAAAGVPTVLLPYPHATDDHQRRNADVFVAAGGALLVDERQLTGRLDDQLAETVGMLVAEADRLAAMSQAMLGLGRPDAAADVAALVWSVVSSQARRSRLPAAA
jgi:UDP-N-acetylglucosamine--N-acetylmuramyl-(pentapeptide) pyrophosphoryl-undecaprenol N-acetylglucosamine transferase